MRKESVSSLLKLFFFVYVFMLFVSMSLFSLAGIEEPSHKLTELFDQMKYLEIFLLAVVLAPVFEEFIFRYYLCSPKLLIYGLPVIMLGFGGFALFNGSMDTVLIFLTIGVAIIMNAFIFLKKGFAKGLERSFYRYYPYVVYSSAVVFAYIHIYNFDDAVPWYYTPILVVPQFILGLFLAYVRIRNGILYSIIIHSLNNMIPMLLLLMVPESLSGL